MIVKHKATHLLCMTTTLLVAAMVLALPALSWAGQDSSVAKPVDNREAREIWRRAHVQRQQAIENYQGIVALAAANAAERPAAPSGDARDEELRQLRERVRQLEDRLAKVEQHLAATTAPAQGGANAASPTQVSQAQRDALKLKARARSRQDAKKYKPEQLAECEQLYQVANKNWRAPEAITSLKQMIEKYPDVNRTGCAVLYLGQMSEGDDRENYLKQAVEKHSDCFYFDGVQVGGFARYLLGNYYKETAQPEKAKKLFDEIVKDYPDSITHNGDSLAALVKEEANTQPGK